MPSEPTIAFCTTCKGRLQHLRETLPRNISDNSSYARLKFILLDYSCPDGLADYVRSEIHSEHLESGRFTLYRFPSAGTFRMAHAKNLAHRLGMREGADILVNIDADNFTGPDFAGYIAEQFNFSDDIFLWSRMVKGQLPRGISGRIAVTRPAFLNTGGYDETFDTWSPDDKDFNSRLRRIGYQAQEIASRFLGAILHNDKLRFREYPDAQSDHQAEMFQLSGREHVSVTNFGNIGQGIVFRNFEPEPIEIARVPTRIFGIGMHKTATTSLHHALRILGYDSAHWKSAPWAKAIWREMRNEGKSRTLERHYAICDLPMPLLFRDLDRGYPGSKFILTTRTDEDWLQSVEHHFSFRNPFRAGWDSDVFSHRVHRQLYGRQTFDREVFLERYRRHNQEVRDYFKDRPTDLLELNMSAGCGWYELCAFLKQPIPQTPYPWRFQSER